ncbi:hypothetical protein BG006_004122, partial [Podila minutissima]
DGSGHRSVRFDLQGLHRTCYTLRIHEPTLLHTKEDRRPSTSPEPTTTQCLHYATDFQNGDDGNVSLERETVPIQGSTLRSLLGTTDLHQGPPPNPTMGQGTRDPDLGISRRPDYHGHDQGTITDRHKESAGQAGGTGFPSQDKQIADDPNPASGSLGLHDRHHHHVPRSTRQQDQGHQASGQQDGTNGNGHPSPTLLVHRQGNSN